jgi:class 3 adenylate cyclase
MSGGTVTSLRGRLGEVGRRLNSALQVLVGAPSAGTQEAERRQVTVVFCDMVGSTERSRRVDPEDSLNLTAAYRDQVRKVVARYEGHVAREVGDALLIYFGWPVAHEDDAERGVLAALGITEAVKAVPASPPLSVHIGVGTATVVIEPRTSEAHGDAPILAERLHKLAKADQVLISRPTKELLGDAFTLESLGQEPLKGLDDQAEVWRVVRPGDASNRFVASRGKRLTPLVGRARDLAWLVERWEQARAGTGRVVLLSGEAGIGKSRLLRELGACLEAQSVQALHFQCSPYHVNSAFWPWVDHLERALRESVADGAPSSRPERLEALVVGSLGLPATDLPFIASILSIAPGPGREPPALTPRRQKEETLRALVDAAAAAARTAPVLLFEDLHWADATTLEVLDLLVDRVRHLPLLLVFTHRPEFRNRWKDRDHVDAVELGRLTPEESVALVARVLGERRLPAHQVDQILNRTEGVPLYVEELTKSTVESGHLPAETGDHYEYRGAYDLGTVPTSLRNSLMARLDRDMPVKEIAQIGAAIGREFGLDLLCEVTHRSNAELRGILDRLTASGLAYRKGARQETTYTFKHALVHVAAYESLLISRRQRLHAEIARSIERRFPNLRRTEPEVLAHHYQQAQQFGESADCWITAGQNALDRLAWPEAIAHLQAGMSAIESLPSSRARDALELECRVKLSTAWEAHRGWASPQLTAVLTPALPLARELGQPKVLARTLWGLWVQKMSLGPVAQSLEWARQLLEAGQGGADEELLLVGHMAVMVTNLWLGRPVEVRRHANAILARYVRERHGQIAKTMNHDPKTLAGIYLSQALWMLGWPDKAAALVDARDEHARRIGHPFDTSFALTLGTWVFHYRREPQRQLERVPELTRLAREAELEFAADVLAPFLVTGIGLAQQGRLADGIADMQRGIRSWRAGHARTVTPYIRACLGEAIARSGNVRRGLRHVDLALAQIARPGWEERSHLAEILRLKGWMLSLQGDADGARRNYLASLRFARAQQARSWELRTAIGYARLLLAQGEIRKARDRLTRIYGWFTEGFDTPDLVEARQLLAELESPRRAAA